jgi:hypothetical protein
VTLYSEYYLFNGDQSTLKATMGADRERRARHLAFRKKVKIEKGGNVLNINTGIKIFLKTFIV